MITLTGYENFINIHDGTNSKVYRARRMSDRQPVILKFLNREYPSLEQIRRYKQEYSLTSQLDCPGIIKAYCWEEWQKSYVIVFEDFGGISLQKWLKNQGYFSLEDFILIAIAAIESLGQIHNQNIIHKDINPSNLVFNPQTQELKIIDFGISTQLNRENPSLKNSNILEGTLPYISPEQTGRMNRSLDYRTDFYSLGVTFYELLTQQLPFVAEDALELIHCHLARKPQSPSEINPFIPEIISDIILKLIAKNAEDRYQSAYGLKHDLETCYQQLQETAKIPFFSLGQQDISEQLQIPQKLYGRDQEITQLLAEFKEVAATGKVKLMLIAGYSGIGKSSLVQELYKPITAHRGYFIAGKFDQFQQNIPYSAIVAAFRDLVKQLLGETETTLQIWREKLLKALGNNGKIIIDVIPELQLIIGEQPAVLQLGANEEKNRFNFVFSNFIHVFCTSEHPLTLFLDDLQWADFATLKLLEIILFQRQTEYLFLLGSYRDNEVYASNPLVLFLKNIQQDNQIISQIYLKSLSLEKVENLISDTLSQNSESVRDLAQLISRKTGGNPFFINEFLHALYEENFLIFHRQSRCWQWNLDDIEARDFTDNMVELMVEQLQKLPLPTQEILSLAACWGATFELKFLTWMEKKSEQEIFALFKTALNRGLIVPLSEPDENLLIQSYKFGHDRIQQAAYALISDDHKATIHHHIGQVLLDNLSPETREDKIFELVNQLNYGKTLISQQKERDQLAQLNLIACRKAKSAAAYQTAREYINIGLFLLGENPWQRQYKITLAFHDLEAELASLCGDLEAMEKSFAIVIVQAKSLPEKVNVYRIKILSNVSHNQLTEAIYISQKILKQLGVTFPTHSTQNDIQQIIVEINELIGTREIGDLLHLPMMTEVEKIAILEIANSIIPAAYMSASPLFAFVVALSVKLSIEYGNTSVSASAYAPYGVIICTHLQDVNTGFKFAQLAYKLVSKLNIKAFQSEVLHVFGMFILHRKSHLKETLTIFQTAYENSLEIGNLEYVGYTAEIFCLYAFLSGQPLRALEQQTRNYYNQLVELNQSTPANHCQILLQSILRLLGIAQKFNIVSWEIPQELCLFYLHKLILSYLFAEIKSAQLHAVKTRVYLAAAAGTIIEPVFYFYDSLAALATLTSQSERRLEILQRVEQNQTKLQQHWANYAPMNHQHKVDLVEAEKFRILGKKAEAVERYNQAIAGAKLNKYIQEEALANELTAKFYLDWNQEKIARVYMQDAHYCYSRWGATAKVKHLEKNYPQLCFSSINLTSDSKILNSLTIQDSTDGEVLDLATVLKSTNTISSEIILERLLATLIEILVENAGARRGILILSRRESLFVEATKEIDVEGVLVLQSIPISHFEKLPSKIIHYVIRTRETVVLNNAADEGKFTNDPYIQQYQCQSIACTPLINQGKLQGIIYLENNLTTGAFTQERLSLLRTLAIQGAISLENARLYDNITTLNTAYERFVPAQFLNLLDKESIAEVQLGDQVEREMTVLFSDIRDFTFLSEQMTPADNFAFINEYLGYMEPKIQQYGGFIDKYIGDGIMALFANSADDAVQGAIAMLEELKIYNYLRQERSLQPLRIGIGIHTGRLTLGTVGGFGRMDGTAIGDAVNLSSRVEGLTKTYGVSLLITHQTFSRLNDPLQYDFRFIDKVKAKGKTHTVSLFEVFSSDPPELREAKITTKATFERAVLLYHQGTFQEAAYLFQTCLATHKSDHTACYYLEHCHQKIASNSSMEEQ